MASENRFALGSVALAFATVAAVALVGHLPTAVTRVGIVVALVLAVLGLAAHRGHGFDPASQNRLRGVLSVFATMAAYGLLVVALLVAIE